MNRLKKELRKRGVKLENDYPWLPYDFGSQSLESVVVNSEEAEWYEVYSSIVVKLYIDRAGHISWR